MATVVLSNLAHISDFEAKFFAELMGSLRSYGHRVFFWSAVSKKSLDESILPMRWRIADLENLFSIEEFDFDSAMAEIDVEKWQVRVDVLAKQNPRAFPQGRDLEILVAVTSHVLEMLQPDLFLAWNPLCPHFGVAHDLCVARGIPSLLIERAFFPDTWFIEEGGLVGHSRLAGLSLNEMISDADPLVMAKVGRDYLSSSPFGSMERYAQRKESSVAERLFSGDLSDARPRIAFLPPDDLSLGAYPDSHEDHRKRLPGFKNSFDAAQALSKANSLGTTVFKPHPSFLEWRFTSPDSNLISLNYNYSELIEWADLVATTGSGLEFTALAAGKPVISLGRDALTGKGIAYEALDSGQVDSALAEAVSGEGAAERQENFEAFVGYALTNCVVSHPTASRSYLRPVVIAERLHERFLINKESVGFDRSEADLIAELCNLELKDPESTDEQQPNEPTPVFPISITDSDIANDLVAIEEELLADPQLEAVVDLDYTLLQSNSTELYLDTVTPKWAGYLIGKLVQALRLGWLFSGRGEGAVAYDQCRVFLVTLFLPWTYFLWLRRAPRIAEKYSNRRLIASVKAGSREKVTVISNGFAFVIRPLLKNIGIEVDRLVASGPIPSFRNVAAEGKVRAFMRAFPGVNLRRVLFVTDSRSDSDLLEAAGRSYLIQWPCDEFKAYRNTYFPFRYTAEGKYRGEGVVKRHRFGEDLIVLVLAYQAFVGGIGGVSVVPEVLLWNLWMLLSLFFSFHSVYEIGYYENDFKASLLEEKPNVNSAVRAFQEYPIGRMGWLYGIVFGVLAFLPGLFSEVVRDGPDSWIYSLIVETGRSFVSPAIHVFCISLAVWLGVLIATRLIFRVHNRLPVSWRTSTFALLQGVKLMAFSVFFQLTFLGAALIISQVMRHLSNYVVYRQAGSRRSFPRQLHRLQIFGTLTVLLFLVQPTIIGLGGVQLWAIFAWCIWMAAVERYAPRVSGRRAVVVRGILDDLFRFSRKST